MKQLLKSPGCGSAECRSVRRTVPPGKDRRGVALVAMMVLLAVFMLLAASWVRRIVAERQEVRRYEREVQATRLAESGLARARAQLANSADYKGELWEIPADSWESHAPAEVQIDVQRDGSESGIEITARAKFPKGDARAVQRTRRLIIQFPISQL
jgi:type II secretory pathway pseudopilin PulG